VVAGRGMRAKLRFLGAAQNVTGSRYLIDVNGQRVLVDCGLYQERQFRARNWKPFAVPPASIDAVLLTHAHLDHCGLLPKLVAAGFKGRIYCTEATAEIAKIVLLDSAKIQEEDAAYKQKRHAREGRRGRFPEVPLYTSADAEACSGLFEPVGYEKTVGLGEGLEAAFYDAGHILGSSMIKVTVKQNGQRRRVLFSGDVGRPDRPIIRDPSVFERADYVLVESTYGDRVHPNVQDSREKIAAAINAAVEAGGNIVVPSFALERAQEVLYYVNQLLLEDKIPPVLTFLDSPMATSVTGVFAHHPELFDREMSEYVYANHSPFEFDGLKMVRTARESKAINHIRGTVIIIAGSGMCTGGRVKHHLVNNITRPESTVLFVGYQAVGTLGREIVDGAGLVRILGHRYPVKAQVQQVQGLSAHADREELFSWLSGLKEAPRQVFVVHGESESARFFGDLLRKRKGWAVSVPAYQDEVILD